MNDDWSCDYERCAVCGEPAAYTLWKGDTLIARHCERHHNEWWLGHDELAWAMREAGEALCAPAPAQDSAQGG